MTLKVGIIGASGIGYTHARQYSELGAEVVAVLCSSQLSAEIVSDKLTKKYKNEVAAYHNLDDFLNEELDAISICSPPSLHIEHIKACFDRNMPVFCEKPLFWDKSMPQEEVSKQISYIRDHKNRRLFVNTSNTVFMDSITCIEGKSSPCESLFFEFYTNGSYKDIDIAQDLLPHGLSLLIHMMGDCEIVDFTCNVSDHIFSSKFYYGGCLVNFDFRENPSGSKHMRIILNGNSYTRLQVGVGSTYEVSLVNDSSKEVISVQDPFNVFISRFLDFVSPSGGRKDDESHIGFLNLNLMVKCLNLIDKCA
jgi:hypothetical protein